MGYVTKTITEYDGKKISVSTSIHFESFEDFTKYERQINAEEDNPDRIIHTLNFKTDGNLEIDTECTYIRGEIEVKEFEWNPHTTTHQPVDDFVQVEVKWTGCLSGEVESDVGRAVEFNWDDPMDDPHRISHYRIIKQKEEN